MTPGTIIKQSRPEGSDVVEGADLTIKVAKKKEQVPETPTTPDTETNPTNNQDTNNTGENNN